MKKIILILFVILTGSKSYSQQIATGYLWQSNIWNNIPGHSVDSLCYFGNFEDSSFKGWAFINLCRFNVSSSAPPKFNGGYGSNSCSSGCDAPMLTGCTASVSNSPASANASGYGHEEKLNYTGNITCLNTLLIPKVKSGNVAAQIGGESRNSVNGHVDGIGTKFRVKNGVNSIKFDVALRLADFTYHANSSEGYGAAFFWAALIDSSGNIISELNIDGLNPVIADPWVNNVTSGASNPCLCTNALSTNISYRPWHSEMLNVPASYVGRNLSLVIFSGDCVHCGHSVVSYIDNVCQSSDSLPAKHIELDRAECINGIKNINVKFGLESATNPGDYSLELLVFQNGNAVTCSGLSYTPSALNGNYTFSVSTATCPTLIDTCIDFKVYLKKKNVFGNYVIIDSIGAGTKGVTAGYNNDLCCTQSPPPCNCGQWGSIGYTINGKANKFLCGTSTVLNANIGDVFTLSPQYACLGTNGQPCNAVIKYDIYYPDGTSLLNQGSLQGFNLTKCGDNRIVMTPSCGGKPCPPCEFTIKVNCCSCQPVLHPYLSWTTGSGQTLADHQKELACGQTYTNELECYQPYSIKVQSPCGANCQPDDVITTIKYSPATGSGLTGYILTGTTLTANLPGTYEVTIKVKCNGIWCKECKIIFKQTKKCDPPCENCKDMVRAGFDASSSTVTAGIHPAGTTVNASFMLGSGGDVFTQVRANVVDLQVSSDNPACLQCYNTPNNWGSILNGSISLPGFSSAVSTWGGISALNNGNNAREIIFTSPAPSAIPMGTPMLLTIKIPGVNPVGCCCLKIVLFVKITYRNAKCEECSKILRVGLKECLNGNRLTPDVGFEPDGGWPQFRQHKPSPEDVKLVEDFRPDSKRN